MDFCFEFLEIHMNEKTIICHDYHGFKWKKHKYLSNFDYFSLQFNALFGLLDCDYTQFKVILNNSKNGERSNYV
jgi:hypothetical protein